LWKTGKKTACKPKTLMSKCTEISFGKSFLLEWLKIFLFKKKFKEFATECSCFAFQDENLSPKKKKKTLLFTPQKIRGCVTHIVALPFTLIKKYLKAKEELRKLKYFTMQKYNLQKILLRKPKSFKIFITLL